MKEKKFSIFFLFLFFLLSFIARIIATPFVDLPRTFNESLAEISVFELNQKVVIRTNVSDSEKDTQYVWLNLTASNGTLIFTNELMFNTSISCGENCSVWEKNYTLIGGDPAGIWVINVSANDTLGNIACNSTTFNVSKYVEIIISQTLQQGISFDLIHPGTVGNPALNNSGLANGGTQYNITVGSSSNTNITFYHKINETMIGIYLNESSSRTSENDGFSSNITLATEWKIMGNSSVNCSNVGIGESCWIRYFIDVSGGIPSQYFEKTYYFCAVYEGGSYDLC